MGGVTSLRKRRAEYIVRRADLASFSDARTRWSNRDKRANNCLRYIYAPILYYTSVILYSSTYIMC